MIEGDVESVKRRRRKLCQQGTGRMSSSCIDSIDFVNVTL